MRIKHPDELLTELRRDQIDDWWEYWQQEPWGDEREDWRQLASHTKWGKIIGGGNGEMPNAFWPYFANRVIDGAKVDRETTAFADAIEPKPGGGWQWKPGREPKDGNDNRQT